MEHNTANLLPFHVTYFALCLVLLLLLDTADRVRLGSLFCCHLDSLFEYEYIIYRVIENFGAN
jgi:hypothetical protein